MYSAASLTVRTSGPKTEKSVQGIMLYGPMGIRPNDGFIPGSPVQQAGMRTLPPPSEPVQKGTWPPATAADDPPLEPPGVRSGFQGLRLIPHSRFLVNAV